MLCVFMSFDNANNSMSRMPWSKLKLGRNLSIYDKSVLLYIAIYFVSVLAFSSLSSVGADEGTHSLLALFYKDLATSVIENRAISFQKMYDFGISYLVHYPKLQVFYPPLYHIITGFVFYNVFGVSIFASRLCNLAFVALSLLIFYHISKKLSNEKAALIAVLLLSIFPETLLNATRAMTEFTTVFFILCSLFFFLKSLKSNRWRDYLLVSFFIFLSVLSKQPGGITAVVYFVLLIAEKRFKQAFVLLAFTALLLLPYAALIIGINGLQLGETIYTRYAFESMDWGFFIAFPFMLFLFFAFFVYLYKSKDKNKKMLGTWFFVFFIGIMLISFKSRYFIYFIIPTLIVAGEMLSKINFKLILVFMVLYTTLSLNMVLPTVYYYPVEGLAKEIYGKAPSGSGVAMLTESDYPFYSSALIFHLSALDGGKSLFFYRSCTFSGKSGQEIIDFFNKNNVYFVFASADAAGYEEIGKIRGAVTNVAGVDGLYVYSNFKYSEKNEFCNFVCLTNEPICTAYKTPYEVFA